MHVDPKHHWKIIGRAGQAINQLREKHGVYFIMPKRGDTESDLITIQGYEANCNSARNEVEHIVKELVSAVLPFVVNLPPVKMLDPMSLLS